MAISAMTAGRNYKAAVTWARCNWWVSLKRQLHQCNEIGTKAATIPAQCSQKLSIKRRLDQRAKVGTKAAAT